MTEAASYVFELQPSKKFLTHRQFQRAGGGELLVALLSLCSRTVVMLPLQEVQEKEELNRSQSEARFLTAKLTGRK